MEEETVNKGRKEGRLEREGVAIIEEKKRKRNKIKSSKDKNKERGRRIGDKSGWNEKQWRKIGRLEREQETEIIE